MTRFGIQAIDLNGTTYGGVAGFQSDPGSEVDSSGLDGNRFETAHHETELKPMADMTTRDLTTLISALDDSTDLPQKALNGSTGLLLVGGKAESGAPGYASGTVHYARRFANGLIYVSGISWSRGGKAEVKLKALMKGTGDGLTSPVDESLIALPPPPVSDFGFSLYSLTVNGVAISRPNSYELAIEPNYEHEYLAGLPVPVDITGAGVRKEMAITGRVDIGNVDIGAGTGACVAVFKRYAIGGGFGTDTLTINLNSPWTREQNSGGNSNAPMSRALLTRTRWNGTTKPLTWTVS